jgi:hypothetical protein
MISRLMITLRPKASGMIVVVAGYPKGSIELLEKAGVELFIHVNSDVRATLAGLLMRLGILPETWSEETK